MDDMNARNRLMLLPWSIGYAETDHVENTTVLIYYFDSPWSLVGLPELNDAIG